MQSVYFCVYLTKYTLYKNIVIIYNLFIGSALIQAASPKLKSVFSEIIDMGGYAMKAKIIYLIFTVVVGIATIVSAIFAVLSYLYK